MNSPLPCGCRQAATPDLKARVAAVKALLDAVKA